MKWHQQLNTTSRSNCLDQDSRPTYMALSLWKLTWSPKIIWFLSTFMSVTFLALKMTQIDELIDYFWTIPPELRPPGKSYVARTLTDHEMASTYNDWDPGVHETLSQHCLNVSCLLGYKTKLVVYACMCGWAQYRVVFTHNRRRNNGPVEPTRCPPTHVHVLYLS